MDMSHHHVSTAVEISLEDLLQSRRATRHFDTERRVSRQTMEELITLANWAPSEFNIQPTHFILIENPLSQPELGDICYRQSQLYEASWVVVFVGDASAWKNHREKTAAMDLACGAITPEYAAFAERSIVGMFSNFTPTDMRVWLTKQAALTAMQFMIAAEGRGVATSPMGGFKEDALKKYLGVPQENVIPMIVCTGYRKDPLKKSRLPITNLLHNERW